MFLQASLGRWIAAYRLLQRLKPLLLHRAKAQLKQQARRNQKPHLPMPPRKVRPKMLKPTWSPNLKKCSRDSFALMPSLVTLAWATFFILYSIPAPTAETALVQNLKSDLQKRKGTSFGELVREWEGKYWTSAFHPLMQIASDPKNSDADRYVAVMGAAKLGGAESAPLFVPLLKDPSWMIRSAALRALTAFKLPQTADAVLPLISDSALVVRAEAVEAVKVLKPKGGVDALVSTLENPDNYHGGKAQWVPQKALSALVALQAKEAISKLVPILEYPESRKDPEILVQTLDTLDSLSGKQPIAGASTAERVARWVNSNRVPASRP
jgi:hypothetical protein